MRANLLIIIGFSVLSRMDISIHTNLVKCLRKSNSTSQRFYYVKKEAGERPASFQYAGSELFCGLDDTVVSAQVHECEEAEQTVIVCIEISVLERLVLAVPESLGELHGDIVVSCQ